MPWTQSELDALKKAYAAGTLRVSFEGRSVEYGSAADLLSRIRIIEAEMASAVRQRSAETKPRIIPQRLKLSMNWIDRAIGAVAPGAALRRLRQRQALGLMQRAYEGAKVGRRTDGWVTAGVGCQCRDCAGTCPGYASDHAIWCATILTPPRRFMPWSAIWWGRGLFRGPGQSEVQLQRQLISCGWSLQQTAMPTA